MGHMALRTSNSKRGSQGTELPQSKPYPANLKKARQGGTASLSKRKKEGGNGIEVSTFLLFFEGGVLGITGRNSSRLDNQKKKQGMGPGSP